jgi:predicted O-linked N-acetylglucosamine transferase (SPINDLY family)
MATMTIGEALGLAREHLQAGRLADGEAVCQAILRAEPRDFDAHRLLGLIACAEGKPGRAEAHVRTALACRPESPEAHLALCLIFASQSRFVEAEIAARRALELRPGMAEAENNLGGALQGQDRFDEAAAAFQRALTLRPSFYQAAYNLGYVRQVQENWEAAAQAYEHALTLEPNLSEAENNLGLVLQMQGLVRPAVEAYRRAQKLPPFNPRASYNLGLALQSLGCIDEAIEAYQAAIRHEPSLHDAASNLGILLHNRGRLEEAVQAYQNALMVKPDFAQAENNLGNALRTQGKLREAIAAYRRALAILPTYAEAECNLGLSYHSTGRLDEAVVAYRRALELRPEFAEAENNLGNTLLAQGFYEEALQSYRHALAIRPSYVAAHSNLLMCEQYRPGATLAGLARMHAEWDQQHAAPLRDRETPATCVLDPDRDPERTLRIGFLSPDLRQHPVGFLLVRALEHLDPRQFEVFCYQARADRDELSDRLQAASKGWSLIVGLDDDELARKIREDRIDILFDLSGHSADHRLLVFARRPAPIQMTWIGYVGTTGLRTIDYLIADRFHIPPGAEEHYHEKVLRMPDGYVCFDPPATAPEVGPLPALGTGHVTFGSFNNVSKLTSEVIALWAAIVQRLPGSRLMLVSPPLSGATTRQRISDAFTAAGGDLAQLELCGTKRRHELLAMYNTIDVALDPFPYSGGVTTCEALWMGVPVVTCPGETFASRHSLSHLSNIGLTETIAANHEEYVDRAARLAQDLPHLAELRAGLRERMARSPLCDGERFAGQLMTVLRDVWRQWCNT